MPFVSEPNRKTGENPDDNEVHAMNSDEPNEMATVLKCPVCGHPYRMGELVCANCQHIFSMPITKTQRFDALRDITGAMKSWPAGDSMMSEQKPIIFEISGEQVVLPVADVVSVGRRSSKAGDDIPHVDLSQFDAEEHGVSRTHIQIRRKGILVYVCDLNSTNGTHLNGRRLIANGERLLRDGDELHLSRLRIKVRF